MLLSREDEPGTRGSFGAGSGFEVEEKGSRNFFVIGREKSWLEGEVLSRKMGRGGGSGYYSLLG